MYMSERVVEKWNLYDGNRAAGNSMCDSIKIVFSIRHPFTPNRSVNTLWSAQRQFRVKRNSRIFVRSVSFIMQFWQLQRRNESEVKRFFLCARKPRQMRNKSARKLYNVERKIFFVRYFFLHLLSCICGRGFISLGQPDFPMFYFQIKREEDLTKRFQIWIIRKT